MTSCKRNDTQQNNIENDIVVEVCRVVKACRRPSIVTYCVARFDMYTDYI